MIIEIRLLARLFRIPLLRVEGAVAIRDLPGEGNGRHPASTPRADASPVPRLGRSASPVGHDLALAEAIMAELDTRSARLHAG